jgi:hypothetical protein
LIIKLQKRRRKTKPSKEIKNYKKLFIMTVYFTHNHRGIAAFVAKTAHCELLEGVRLKEPAPNRQQQRP